MSARFWTSALCAFVMLGCGKDGGASVVATPPGAAAQDAGPLDAGDDAPSDRMLPPPAGDAGVTLDAGPGGADAGAANDAGEAEDEPPCATAGKADGVCHCGCGVDDPDCDGQGCSAPGCNAAACALCHGAEGRYEPCPGFRCGDHRFGDGVCDCGCGTLDVDCGTAGCGEAGCRALACDNCLRGEVVTSCHWTCPPARFSDGSCDCGCGAFDPDCSEGGGCRDPGCFEDACDRCSDGFADVACDDRTACDPTLIDDDDGCDCGCGVHDPDCGQAGCDTPGCAEAACERCHESSGQALPQCAVDGFECAATHYADGVCDCGCGVADPDCEGAGCTGVACNEAACQVCHGGGGGVIPCTGWTCEAASSGHQRNAVGRAAAICDCGCGSADADCGVAAGCSEAACDAQACEHCRGADGNLVPCQDWDCDAARFGDGVCDCGCGSLDPDCDSGGCAVPGCGGQACERCEAVGGGEIACGWTCDAAAYGDGTTCHCGCGIHDPDCGGEGCTGPDCYAAACDVCHAGAASIACSPCDADMMDDGSCDCGCVWADPDCGGDGCAAPGCTDGAACQFCWAAGGTVMACD